MFLGYNTNGFAHHKLEDAIEIIAELGYRGLALTLDVHHLNPFEQEDAEDEDDPFEDAFASRINNVLEKMEEHEIDQCVVETGARFLLDPRQKHQPTLLSHEADDRAYRFDFLCDCIETAAALKAEYVSFWSGAVVDDATPRALMVRLVDGCKRLAELAAARKVHLAFEPEPGMFIDTMEKFEELHSRVDHPAFGLTLDVGHLVCNGELPVSAHIKKWKHVLWNVHIEDMKPGVHDHLMFGDGTVDFKDVFAALREVRYANGVYVELSRHSHDAVNTARKAKAFLDRYV